MPKLDAELVNTILDAELGPSIVSTVVEVPNAAVTLTADTLLTFAAHANRLIQVDSASVRKLEIPEDSTEDMALGTWFEFRNVRDDVEHTVAREDTSGLNIKYGDEDTSQIFLSFNGVLRIVKTGADEWTVTNNHAHGTFELDVFFAVTEQQDFDFSLDMRQVTLRLPGMFGNRDAGGGNSQPVRTNSALPRAIGASATITYFGNDAVRALLVDGLQLEFFEDLGIGSLDGYQASEAVSIDPQDVTYRL